MFFMNQSLIQQPVHVYCCEETYVDRWWLVISCRLCYVSLIFSFLSDRPYKCSWYWCIFCWTWKGWYAFQIFLINRSIHTKNGWCYKKINRYQMEKIYFWMSWFFNEMFSILSNNLENETNVFFCYLKYNIICIWISVGGFLFKRRQVYEAKHFREIYFLSFSIKHNGKIRQRPWTFK